MDNDKIIYNTIHSLYNAVLGFIEIYHAISEPCYEGIILQKKSWENDHFVVILQ